MLNSRAVPYDIWEKVLTSYSAIWNLSKEEVNRLQYICKDFCFIIRPLLYTHIQLLDVDSSFACLTTLSVHPSLATSVRTLQVGFSPFDLEDEDEDMSELFWGMWNAVLPKLSGMTVLGLTYCHDDPACLRRYITRGSLRDCLPASVRRLHLKPTADDYLEDLPVRNTVSVHRRYP